MTTMKVQIPAQTVYVDVEAWQLEYGVLRSEVRDDVKAYFLSHLLDSYPFEADLCSRIRWEQ